MQVLSVLSTILILILYRMLFSSVEDLYIFFETVPLVTLKSIFKLSLDYIYILGIFSVSLETFIFILLLEVKLLKFKIILSL